MMKHKNLLLMALAMLLMVPMQMSAKKGMGWLHFGESGDAYYNESGTTVPVKYNGVTYQAYPVIGYSNVYYVPNEKTFGTKNENLKILYLKGASLTKNIRCTKSTTNLAVVVSGTNSISSGAGSTFKLETGNLYIVGATGPTVDKLTVTQTSKYHAMYADGITIKDVTVTATAKSGTASISQESSKTKLVVNNASVSTTSQVYARGGFQMSNAFFDVDNPCVYSSKDYYLHLNSATGSKAQVINILHGQKVEKTMTNVKVGIITKYIEHDFYKKERVLDGYKRTCYALHNNLNGTYKTLVEGVYYVPETRSLLLGFGGSVLDQGGNCISTDSKSDLSVYVIGNFTFKTPSNGNVSIQHLTNGKKIVFKGTESSEYGKPKVTMSVGRPSYLGNLDINNLTFTATGNNFKVETLNVYNSAVTISLSPWFKKVTSNQCGFSKSSASSIKKVAATGKDGYGNSLSGYYYFNYANVSKSGSFQTVTSNYEPINTALNNSRGW